MHPFTVKHAQDTVHGRAVRSDPAGGEPIAVVAKRLGADAWRKRFGTFQADDVRRLKQLEAENARLKKLVAERNLEREWIPVRGRGEG